MVDEIDFGNSTTTTDVNELDADSFSGGKFLKNPEVGGEIIFEVLKVSENKNTHGKSKTGQEFRVGLRYKDGSYRRYDIETDLGTYTINNWEIFVKLFSSNGLLKQYAAKHNKSFKGAKVSIKRLIDGSHMSTKLPDLAKILGKDLAAAQEYQNNVKKAISEQRLYDVKVLNL